MAISVSESQPVAIKINNPIDIVESVMCDCCGITEECTVAYIAKVREKHRGKWICGLCSEAVKDEIYRSQRIIDLEEALTLHMTFCNEFRSSPVKSTDHLISAMKQFLLRSLDSTRISRSAPNSPVRKEDAVRPTSLVRSESCVPAFST